MTDKEALREQFKAQEKTQPLFFAMPLQFRTELADSADFMDRNAYVSWRAKLEGKIVYLAGMSKDRDAFAISYRLGDYDWDYISGHPYYLFKPAEAIPPILEPLVAAAALLGAEIDKLNAQVATD
jgi:hypothetical protein